MPDIPVTEFGARLKQARVARGISLAQIAAVTRISTRSLEAVERNDFSKLPGGIFTRSFVRAYAGEVGLDPEAALQQFLSQCPGDMAAVPTDAPESIDGPSRHAEWQEKLSWRHAAVALALLALLAIAWYTWQRSPPGGVETPRAEAPPAAMGAPLEPSPIRPTEPAVRSAAATAAAPPVVAAAKRLLVSIALISSCWISVTADGASVASRLFAAGEQLDASAERMLVVKAGDAAAVRVTINGRAAQPLGTPGQVVTVRITPDTWQALLAPEH